MLRVLLLNGPNIDALGRREPQLYGNDSLEDVILKLRAVAENLGIELECCQSSFEGELIDRILVASGQFNFIIINPGAFTHTSIALRDAISASDVPVLEVHITNIYAREEWRNKSVISPVCCGVIAGMGVLGYRVALESCYYLYCSLTGAESAIGVPAGLPSAPEVRSGGFTILDDEGGEASVSSSITHKFRLRDAIAEIDGRIERPSSSGDIKNRRVESSDKSVHNRGVINADILDFGADDALDNAGSTDIVNDGRPVRSATYGSDDADDEVSFQDTVAEDVDMVITRRPQAMERASKADGRSSVAVGISDEAKRARRAAAQSAGAVDVGASAANRSENASSSGESKKRKVNLALNFGQRPAPQRDSRGREAEEHHPRASLELVLPVANVGGVSTTETVGQLDVYDEPEIPTLDAIDGEFESTRPDVDLMSKGVAEGSNLPGEVGAPESDQTVADDQEEDTRARTGWRSLLGRRKKKR